MPSSIRPSRRGGTMAILLMALVPLMAMIAFAVDLNYIWRAEVQLQTAADSAAQAGATRLSHYVVKASQGGLTDIGRAAVRAEAQQAVAARAVTVGQMHRVGDDDLDVRSEDVELGFVADPGAPPGTTAGQFQTGSTAPFPNSVRVTVRRDASVPKGPLKLFFGPVGGTPTASRTAAGIATIRGQNVTGFNGSGGKLLPLAMSLLTFQELSGAAVAPAGALTDNRSAKARIDGGAAPPGNVTLGPDGIKEAPIYPDRAAPGNFGLLSLNATGETSTGPFANWILNGPSAADLASFGSNGLQAGATIPGGPGMKSSLFDEVATQIGQPRVAVIVGPPSGNGSNVRYPVLGFTGVVIVSVEGGSIFVQLHPVIDPTARLGGGPDVRPGGFIYRGISVSR